MISIVLLTTVLFESKLCSTTAIVSCTGLIFSYKRAHLPFEPLQSSLHHLADSFSLRYFCFQVFLGHLVHILPYIELISISSKFPSPIRNSQLARLGRFLSSNVSATVRNSCNAFAQKRRLSVLTLENLSFRTERKRTTVSYQEQSIYLSLAHSYLFILSRYLYAFVSAAAFMAYKTLLYMNVFVAVSSFPYAVMHFLVTKTALYTLHSIKPFGKMVYHSFLQFQKSTNCYHSIQFIHLFSKLQQRTVYRLTPKPCRSLI